MPATSEPALRLQGLVKAYPGTLGLGRRQVLHGIDLELAPGELLGLLGPNGSGKTTLLRLVAGIERADGGSLSILGGTPAVASVRRRIGFLPEDSPFPPELGARAALELFGALQGLGRVERRRRAEAWLERVELADQGRRPIGRFSKGMLRRFGLAQALLHGPDLVLLDEPTAGLDAVGAGLFDELLTELLERGAAVVVSSHQLTDVFDRAARLCVLIEGRVAACGPPTDLVAGTGRAKLELEGLDAQGLERLAQAARDAGARDVHGGPGSGALLEIYRRFARSEPTR